MTRGATDVSYHHESVSLGLRVDVSDIGAVLDLLDDDERAR